MATTPPGRFDAQRLQEARLARGLSQVQLAQRVGVDPSVLNSWETRVRRPSLRNRSRVAFALGLSVSDLYLSDSDAVGTLIDLRVKAGLTQRQLAAELGVTQTRVSGWERGLARPTPDEAGLYAVIVGCDEDTLSAALDRTPRRGSKRNKTVRGALAGAPNDVAPSSNVNASPPLRQRTPEARAAADIILALLKKYADQCHLAVSAAAAEERNAKPEDRERARDVRNQAEGHAQGAYWAWYAAHTACLDYFDDRPENPVTDICP